MSDQDEQTAPSAPARPPEAGEREGENVREGVDHVQHDEQRQLRPLDGPENTNRASGPAQ
jgi:hypothetical protein